MFAIVLLSCIWSQTLHSISIIEYRDSVKDIIIFLFLLIYTSFDFNIRQNVYKNERMVLSKSSVLNS